MHLYIFIDLYQHFVECFNVCLYNGYQLTFSFSNKQFVLCCLLRERGFKIITLVMLSRVQLCPLRTQHLLSSSLQFPLSPVDVILDTPVTEMSLDFD